MKLVQINVDEIDIKEGIPRSSVGCPIALACKRTGVPELKQINVISYMVIRNGLDVGEFELFSTDAQNVAFKSFKLPEDARVFIRRFDQSLPVSPFSFYLEIP